MKAVIINQRYLMNVWMTSIIVTPFFLIVIFAIQEGVYWNVGYLSLYILFIFAEVLLALPSIFLHTLAFRELVENLNSVMLLKSLLSVISISTLAFTYMILEKIADYGYGRDIIILLSCFGGAVIISSFIYKVKVNLVEPI